MFRRSSQTTNDLMNQARQRAAWLQGQLRAFLLHKRRALLAKQAQAAPTATPAPAPDTWLKNLGGRP